ncbi:hypothetical protein [Spirulina sp. CCNP1310]
MPLDFKQLQSNVSAVMQVKPLLDEDGDRLLHTPKPQN